MAVGTEGGDRKGFIPARNGGKLGGRRTRQRAGRPGGTGTPLSLEMGSGALFLRGRLGRRRTTAIQATEFIGNIFQWTLQIFTKKSARMSFFVGRNGVIKGSNQFGMASLNVQEWKNGFNQPSCFQSTTAPHPAFLRDCGFLSMGVNASAKLGLKPCENRQIRVADRKASYQSPTALEQSQRSFAIDESSGVGKYGGRHMGEIFSDARYPVEFSPPLALAGSARGVQTIRSSEVSPERNSGKHSVTSGTQFRVDRTNWNFPRPSLVTLLALISKCALLAPTLSLVKGGSWFFNLTPAALFHSNSLM